MKNVIITSGTYGYKPDGAKHVTPKSRADDPFPLPDAEADRLVALKVAEYVDDIISETDASDVATGTEGENGGEDGGNTSESDDGAEGEEKDTPHLDADDLMEMTRADMDKLAIDMGADPTTVKKAKNKAEVAAIIASIEVEPVDDGEEPPDLGTEDPKT